jgi:Glycosyltransferase family 92
MAGTSKNRGDVSGATGDREDTREMLADSKRNLGDYERSGKAIPSSFEELEPNETRKRRKARRAGVAAGEGNAARLTDAERAERKAQKRAARAARAAAQAKPPEVRRPSRTGRAALFGIGKNEGVYLHEWIAYHHLLGFNEILFYDNDSTDGSAELLSELSGYGLVTAIRWHVDPDVSPQMAAYRHGLERLGDEYGWVAFVDLDEFLVLPQHETIHDFLADFGGQDALGINWKNFGSSGHRHYSPGLVIDRFRGCSTLDFGRNRRVKPFVSTSVIARPGIHTPKLIKPAQYVDITGERIRDGRSLAVHHDVIRLNHYYTKSLEEWRWKLARGRGGKPEARPDRKHWYPDFEGRDRNEDVETDIVRRLPQLRELIRRTPTGVEVSLPPDSYPWEANTAEKRPATALPSPPPKR